MKSLILALACVIAASGSTAGPLHGKRYVIELTTSQFASGYGAYLVPPLVDALAAGGLEVTSDADADADVVVNVVTDRDNGQWIERENDFAWMYTVMITVGISPAGYVIPEDQTPAFGVRAVLLTPNPDRDDELACLIKLAARTALAHYAPTGVFQTDGSSCLRARR